MPPARGAFPPTQWSMILDAGEGSESVARAALEAMCRQYWYPLYSFVRGQGRTHHEAEDCTQEFLARLLASDGVARARPERGRFRSFLLMSLRNCMANEWQRGQAAKRGAGQSPLSLDFEAAGERFAHEAVDPGLSPEKAFDHNYAAEMIGRAIDALRADYEATDRDKLFAALRPHMWGNASPGSFALQAEGLGMKTHAFTVALQRLRRRLGERLRAEVRRTVASEAEVDAELRYMMDAMGDPPPAR